MAHEQRAETDSLSLRIGETPDDEILRQLALHLQPLFRAPVFVDRAASLCDHALPAFELRAFPDWTTGGVTEAMWREWQRRPTLREVDVPPALSDVAEQAWGRFVGFSDPDGNRWVLQELPARP